MQQNESLYDKLIHLPGIRRFAPFLKKHEEVLAYLFFGGVSFFINVFLFIAIDLFTDINELVNNVICWVVCVLFQYVTNRKWVFDAETKGALALIKQMASFFGGRVFTLVVEEAILMVFITWLHLNSAAVKLSAQVVVIVLNYVISKLIVFKK